MPTEIGPTYFYWAHFYYCWNISYILFYLNICILLRIFPSKDIDSFNRDRPKNNPSEELTLNGNIFKCPYKRANLIVLPLFVSIVFIILPFFSFLFLSFTLKSRSNMIKRIPQLHWYILRDRRNFVVTHVQICLFLFVCSLCVQRSM